MRILVAGATGAVGRPLLRMLGERGHEVAGTTRTQARTGLLREFGAEPIICDALDPDAVYEAVARWRPEAMVNQLTALSAPLNPRRYVQWLEPTNRLRAEGTRHLAQAAVAAGTRLLVSQSVAFAYRWDGTTMKTEDDPLFDAFDHCVKQLTAGGSESRQSLEQVERRLSCERRPWVWQAGFAISSPA